MLMGYGFFSRIIRIFINLLIHIIFISNSRFWLSTGDGSRYVLSVYFLFSIFCLFIKDDTFQPFSVYIHILLLIFVLYSNLIKVNSKFVFSTWLYKLSYFFLI